MVRSLETPMSKFVWNCSRSLCKGTGRPSSGQYCPVVTKGFSCAAKYAISCIVCYEGLGIPEFMQKTEFRSKVLKVAKSKIDVERERGKKAMSDTVTKTVMGESFNPFIDQGRQYIKYVAKELVKHPTFKSDLVIGLACFDYGVLLKLPKTVAVDCYQHLFQSFSSRVGLHGSCGTCTLTIT